ncbi:MAG: hypothetical protein AB1696_06790 [Planctomycetota bacterium]
MGDRNPHSPYPDAIRMTKVKRADYKTYLVLKNEGRILAEERRGKYIYFAVQTRRDVQSNAPSNPVVTINVIERYKAKVAAEEKTP